MRTVRIVMFCVGLALPSTAFAQQGTASLRGRVADEQGGVLPGVTVVVTHQESGVYREVVSNADGSYFVTGLVPGHYRRRRASSPASSATSSRDVLLEVGRTATLDVSMSVGGARGDDHRHRESPLVDLTSKQVGGNITQGEMTEMPNATRNWLGFVGLLPGIQVQSTTISFGGDSINVNGQSNRNNNFVVDGGGNNDDYLGQAFGGQTRIGARGGAGVPGPHQPVRRRVRPLDRRGGERGHQAGHQPLPRQRLRLLHRLGVTARRTSSPTRPTSPSPTPASRSGAAPSAARSSATRPTSSAASSGCRSTTGAATPSTRGLS